MATYLSKDLVVDEEKFNTAAQDMRALKKLSTMYEELAGAMDTEAGHEAQLEAKNVLLKPIENMSLVVNHISDTLDTVIGNGYYKDVFTGFENLSHLF